MLKANKLSGKKLDELYEAYDTARREAKEADKTKEDAGAEIKKQLGDIEAAHTPNYRVTFAYDKDCEADVFDEDKFAEKDPKGYLKYQQTLAAIQLICKKYTKHIVTKGARKLIVTAIAE
jgi:hypothetical protein